MSSVQFFASPGRPVAAPRLRSIPLAKKSWSSSFVAPEASATLR
jgi:hypothetical protein